MDAKKFNIYTSDDGVNFTFVSGIMTDVNDRTENWKGISTHSITFKPITTRYIKIEVEPEDKFPTWQGANGKPFVFVDEICVE